MTATRTRNTNTAAALVSSRAARTPVYTPTPARNASAPPGRSQRRTSAPATISAPTPPPVATATIPAPMPPMLLNMQQAAGVLGISYATMKRLVYRREVASLRVGGSRRISVDALSRYVADQEADEARVSA